MRSRERPVLPRFDGVLKTQPKATEIKVTFVQLGVGGKEAQRRECEVFCLLSLQCKAIRRGEGYLWVLLSPQKLCKMGTTQLSCAESSARNGLSSPKCPWKGSTIFFSSWHIVKRPERTLACVHTQEEIMEGPDLQSLPIPPTSPKEDGQGRVGQQSW